MSNQNLNMAFQLIQSGRAEQARPLLEQAIREDRHNIAAWKLYASTWTDRKDQIRVWEFCLRHNPGSALAQQTLASLRSPQEQKQAVSQKADVPVPAVLTPHQRKDSPRGFLWASFIAFIALIGLAIYIVLLSVPKDPNNYRHTQPVEYYLYVPKAYTADKEWPLFVGIHGAGGNGLDCWNLWQAHAEKEGFILLCPTIPGDANGFRMDVGENTVWSAIGEVKKDYRIKQRMFLSGFSAGAFFIQGFTSHYPQYVSGLSILSSGMYLDPRLFAELVPMLVVIGGSDHSTAVATSELFVNDLKYFGFDVQYKVMPGVGHAVTREGITLTIDVFRKTINR